MDCPTDPAVDIIVAYSSALQEAFSPEGRCPPVAGTDNIRFVAGEGPALAAFDVNTRGSGKCKEPFVWVRLARRFRTDKSRAFIQPILDTSANCGALPRVVAIETGVARCSVAVNERASWDDYEREAQQSLDDSWRLELAMCRAQTKLQALHHDVATDVINPAGPDGGVIAWVANAYVRL